VLRVCCFSFGAAYHAPTAFRRIQPIGNTKLTPTLDQIDSLTKNCELNTQSTIATALYWWSNFDKIKVTWLTTKPKIQFLNKKECKFTVQHIFIYNQPSAICFGYKQPS